MKRFFEKISFKEFKKSYGNNKTLYEQYKLPKRATMCSAGNDFYAIEKIIIRPGEIVKIPTGYKASFGTDEVLMIVVRSSMGFKYNVRMCNQVGIIESDYYNNPDNEGHIYVALQNEGTKDFIIEKDMAYAQGIFMKFLVTDNDDAKDKRIGGIGSTNKKEGK